MAKALRTLRIVPVGGGRIAASQIRIGSGAICDTREDAIRYVAAMGDRPSGTPANPDAATVAFYGGNELGQVHNGKDCYRIIEIEVVACAEADGVWRIVAPRRRQYTAIRLSAYAA